MQTRPAFLVSYVATVSTSMANFNVPTYVARTRARFNTESVGVSVAAGSVIVTTELGTDDEGTANGLVDEVGNMDSGELESLFDAPAVVDSVTSQANPDAVAPPSGPPTRSEDDHVVLSIIIICVVLVPVAVFLLYLWMDRTKPLPQAATTKAPRSPRPSKPYRPVNTNEDLSSRPASQVRFKIEF